MKRARQIELERAANNSKLDFAPCSARAAPRYRVCYVYGRVNIQASEVGIGELTLKPNV